MKTRMEWVQRCCAHAPSGAAREESGLRALFVWYPDLPGAHVILSRQASRTMTGKRHSAGVATRNAVPFVPVQNDQ